MESESYTALQHDGYKYFGKLKEQQSSHCELFLTTYLHRNQAIRVMSLRVCKRAEERGGGPECGWCERGVHERRGHKRGTVRFGAIINWFGIGIEIGVIVVTAVIIILDNVLMCNVVRVRILAIDTAMFMTEDVVASIDIIVCTNAAGVTEITGWETDTAVMLSRAIGTLIIVEMRRWKCRGVQVRLRCLEFF